MEPFWHLSSQSEAQGLLVNLGGLLLWCRTMDVTKWARALETQHIARTPISICPRIVTERRVRLLPTSPGPSGDALPDLA